MPTPGLWTPEEDAELRRLWDSHEPAASIALKMGRTLRSVLAHRHELRLTPRSRPNSGRRRPEESLRTQGARVALTEDESLRLDEVVRASGLSTSSYLRELLATVGVVRS